MLEPEYTKLEDIPVDKRGAYVPKDGKFVLDTLSDKHPLVVKKNELKTEVSAKQGLLTKATNTATELQAKSIPEGHVAIPVADKQLLDVVKQQPGTAQEIAAKLKTFDDVVARNAARTKKDHDEAVAKVLKWKPEVFAAIQGLPETDVRDKVENGNVVKGTDGQPVKIVIAKIKGADGVVTEKPFLDYFNATPSLKIFEPSLKLVENQQFVPFPQQSNTGEPVKSDATGSYLDSQYERPDKQTAK